jgi:hypothetical protein
VAGPRHQETVRAGDSVELLQPDGSVRRGVIVEVLGHPAHTHFQVRWSAAHESMVFPGENVRIIAGEPPPRVDAGRGWRDTGPVEGRLNWHE